jgi:hypothetical protein
MEKERRKARRVVVPGLRVACGSGVGGTSLERVLDVSSHGAFVCTENPSPLARRLWLDFQLSPGVGWSAFGEVVWVRLRATHGAPAGMGVRLVNLEAAAVEAIERMLEGFPEAASADPASR